MDHYTFIHYYLITHNDYGTTILILLTKWDIIYYNKIVYSSNLNLNKIIEIYAIY